MEDDSWQATYNLNVYGRMHLVGASEDSGHRVDITLEDHPAFQHSLHFNPDLTLKRNDEPCSLDHMQECQRAAYDATLDGYPAEFGLFLPLLNPLPDGYTITTEPSGAKQVSSSLPAQARGALGPGTLQFIDGLPIPQQFRITIPNEILEGQLEQVAGEFPQPQNYHRSKPSPTVPSPSAYPGSDQDFLGIGMSPDAMLAALIEQQPQAQTEWEAGACLRSFTIFINPSTSTLPQTGAIETYRAVATMENPDGTATTWDFQTFPLAQRAVLVSSTSQPAEERQDCLSARSYQMTKSAAQFWQEATARDHRGEPNSFFVDAQPPFIGQLRAGPKELHYGAQYIPPDTFFGSVPNIFLVAATDGRFLFLETDLQEPMPPR